MIKILNFSVKTRKYTHSIINDVVPVTLARNQASSSRCTCHYLPEEKKNTKITLNRAIHLVKKTSTCSQDVKTPKMSFLGTGMNDAVASSRTMRIYMNLDVLVEVYVSQVLRLRKCLQKYSSLIACSQCFFNNNLMRCKQLYLLGSGAPGTSV